MKSGVVHCVETSDLGTRISSLAICSDQMTSHLYIRCIGFMLWEPKLKVVQGVSNHEVTGFQGELN